MKFTSVLIPTLSAALLALPLSAALTVFGDDFESPAPVPETGTSPGLTGWTTTGAAGFFGRFNADDDTGINWYHGVSGTDFDDTSSAGGQVNSMNGPTKGTIFNGAAGTSISRAIGTIEANTIYSADIALSGQRSAGGADNPDGYSIDLLSGTTVIATTSGTGAQTALLLFDDVSVSWDSSAFAGLVGTNLSFRITTDGTGAGNNYLDFDDVVFSETIVPEPSSVLLLGLSGLALTLRRRRA